MSQAVPHKPIVHSLRGLVLRARFLMVLRGALITVGAATLALLIAIGIDAIFSPEKAPIRWSLTAGLALVAGVALARYVVHPWTRRIQLKEMSLVYDARHRESSETFTSALHFMESAQRGTLSGSEVLASEVVDRAIDEAKGVKPAQEFRLRSVGRHMLFAAIIVSILLSLWSAWPYHITRLIARVVNPASDYGNLYALNMQVSPGNGWVPEGSPVTISLRFLRKHAKTAELHRHPVDGGEVTVEPMLIDERRENGELTFALTFPHVTAPFHYRVVSDRGVSDLYKMEVRPYPTLTDLTVAYTPPSYTGWKPSNATLDDGGELRGLTGTAVTLAANLSQPLASADLILPDETEVSAILTKSDPPQATWRFKLGTTMNGNWRYRLIDLEGLETLSDPFSLVSVPDAAPTIAIVTPSEKRVIVNPTDSLPLHYIASDDVQLQRVRLKVSAGAAMKAIQKSQAPSDCERRRSIWRYRDGRSHQVPVGKTPALRNLSQRY